MTGTEPKHRDWVKLWIKEALIGTIREDLTPAERGTWYDFLLLAGNSRIPGVICANETTAMPTKRIAAILNIEESLVISCIEKFKASGRIAVDENGLIHIAKWGKYQYSDYDRVLKYRQRKKAEAQHPGENTALNEYLAQIRPSYPDLDVDEELVKFNLYWSEGNRQLKRPKLALRNWLNKAREIKGTTKEEPEPEPEHEKLTDDDGRKYYVDAEGIRVYQ